MFSMTENRILDMAKKIRPKNLLSDQTIDVSVINKTSTENTTHADCLDEPRHTKIDTPDSRKGCVDRLFK